MNREPFEGIFGREKTVYLLDFLLAHPFDSYSMMELSEFSGVSRTALYKIIPVFEKFGIVKEARRIGRIRMFQTNFQSEVIKHVIKLNNSLIDIVATDSIKEFGKDNFPEPEPYIPPLPEHMIILYEKAEDSVEYPKSTVV